MAGLDGLTSPLHALRILGRTLSAENVPRFEELWNAAYRATLNARRERAWLLSHAKKQAEAALVAVALLDDFARNKGLDTGGLHAAWAALDHELNPVPTLPPPEKAKPTIRMGKRGAQP